MFSHNSVVRRNYFTEINNFLLFGLYCSNKYSNDSKLCQVRVLPVGWTETRRQEYLAWTRRVLEGGLRGVNLTLEGRLDKILLEHSK